MREERGTTLARATAASKIPPPTPFPSREREGGEISTWNFPSSHHQRFLQQCCRKVGFAQSPDRTSCHREQHGDPESVDGNVPRPFYVDGNVPTREAVWQNTLVDKISDDTYVTAETVERRVQKRGGKWDERPTWIILRRTFPCMKCCTLLYLGDL